MHTGGGQPPFVGGVQMRSFVLVSGTAWIGRWMLHPPSHTRRASPRRGRAVLTPPSSPEHGPNPNSTHTTPPRTAPGVIDPSNHLRSQTRYDIVGKCLYVRRSRRSLAFAGD
jgi:hypothetical protein